MFELMQQKCIYTYVVYINLTSNFYLLRADEKMFCGFVFISLLLSLSLDPAAGWHPAAGGPVGPQDDRCPPQCLWSTEEPGVRQSQ